MNTLHQRERTQKNIITANSLLRAGHGHGRNGHTTDPNGPSHAQRAAARGFRPPRRERSRRSPRMRRRRHSQLGASRGVIACACKRELPEGKFWRPLRTLPRALGASTVAYGRPPAGQLRLLTYAFVSLLRNRTRGPAWCRSHGRAATFLHVSALARGGF